MNFLAEVDPPPGFFDDDLTELGFVMNASRLWAYQPQWQEQIFTTTPALAAAVLNGDDHPLTPAEQALATWARQVTQNPNATTLADVDLLRETGWTDPQIFGITVFTALRIAFSTVNDALGAHPDANYRTLAPAAVLAAVTFGRALETD